MIQETCRENMDISNGLKSALLDSLDKCRIKIDEKQFSLVIAYTQVETDELGERGYKLIWDVSDGFDTKQLEEALNNTVSDCRHLIEEQINSIVKSYAVSTRKNIDENNKILVAAKLNETSKGYEGLICYILQCILNKVTAIEELRSIDWANSAIHYFTEDFQKRWMLLGNYVDDFLQQHQLPEAEILTALSATKYEGSESEARIYFVFDKNELAIARKISGTGKETRYINTNTYRMIRKLMEISKRKQLFLHAEKDMMGAGECTQGKIIQPTYVISGFLEEINKSGDADTKGLYVKFKGYMHWCIVMDGVEVITYRDGMYSINENMQKKEYLAKLESLKQDVDSRGITELEKWFAESRFEKLIDILQQQSHGTTVILSDDTERFRKLCELNRGILLDSKPLYEIIGGAFASWQEQQILSLTEIDGALIMDLNGNGVAIGMIVDGEAKIPGNTSRGARYNTIVNFIKTQQSGVYIAIIVSEDKMINIVWNINGERYMEAEED